VLLRRLVAFALPLVALRLELDLVLRGCLVAIDAALDDDAAHAVAEALAVEARRLALLRLPLAALVRTEDAAAVFQRQLPAPVARARALHLVGFELLIALP